MNPAMLNAYPVGYPLSGDIKFQGRDRGYEYMDRANGLGTGMLDQSMGLNSSNTMDYKYGPNQLQQDSSCNNGTSQPVLTPPQSGDESTSSIVNPPSSSFAYSTLPKVSASNATSLEYYSTANPGFLPSTFNGATMTQSERRPGPLHMPPLSPPYNFNHTFSPYSMARNMPDYSPFSAPRSGAFDPFIRSSRGMPPVGQYTTSIPPFAHSMAQQNPPRAEGPPFEEMTKMHSLVNSQHQNLAYDILASIPKGFFKVEDKWTCYRRNYFTVSCGFMFKSQAADGPVYLQRYSHTNLEQVNAYAVSISARTAAANNTDSEVRGLVQHTPKRDKATESVPGRHVVSPAPASSLHNTHGLNQNGMFPSSHMGPCLPGGLEGFGHPSSQPPQTQFTFERIQFQKATANNGKRRAQQQYFHVVVRLEVSIHRPGGQEDWVTIATKQSSPMVVRGRSPGHYKDTRRDSQSSMDPDGGSGHHHHHHGEGGGLSGYSLNPIGTHHSAGYGSMPSSYRLSHHYGTAFNGHTAHRVDDSDSSSASPGSSIALASSPIKDNMHRPIQRLAHNVHPEVCLDRLLLSSIIDKPGEEMMDYPYARRTSSEDGNGDHFLRPSLEAVYNSSSFDFSATSS